VETGGHLPLDDAYKSDGAGIIAAHCRPVANPRRQPSITYPGADGTLKTVDGDVDKDYLWIIVHKRLPVPSGIVRSGPGPERPVPVYLVYACDYEHDRTGLGRARPAGLWAAMEPRDDARGASAHGAALPAASHVLRSLLESIRPPGRPPASAVGVRRRTAGGLYLGFAAKPPPAFNRRQFPN
jgi:hypothetical protein